MAGDGGRCRGWGSWQGLLLSCTWGVGVLDLLC